jgi:hypothetical protein
MSNIQYCANSDIMMIRTHKYETNICLASEVIARGAVSSSEALPERDLWMIIIFTGCFLRQWIPKYGRGV